MVPLPSRGIFSDNQVSLHNKGRSFLLPSPLKKYREPRAGDPGYTISNGPSVILPSHEVDSVDGGCFNTLLAMKQQIKELQQTRFFNFLSNEVGKAQIRLQAVFADDTTVATSLSRPLLRLCN
jgi:hypothetical protein